MKHYHYLKRYAIIILPIIALIVTLVACKKDKLTQPQSETVTFNEPDIKSSEHIVKRIKDFDKQLRQIKEGVCRGTQSVDIDSALWDIESLFNASFSFPERSYVEKRKQELLYTIDIHDGKYVEMKDVSTLYDDIISTVREAYRNDGIATDKSLMSIVVKRGEIVSGRLQVKLLLITGRTAKKHLDIKLEPFSPFKDDACWYYGEYGGSCDDPTIVYDAATALEDVINFNYANDIEESKKYRNLYVNMTNISLSGDEYWNDKQGDYYMFYKVNCPESSLYLDSKTLNKYFTNIVTVIFKLIPNDAKYSSVLSKDVDFIEVNIDGMFSLLGKNKIYNHNTDILYGSKFVVSNTQMAMPKDLLK